MTNKNKITNFKKINLKEYISTSGIIKLCIKVILICAIVLIILESKEPREYSINEIENLSLHTPILISGTIKPIYIEESFSIVEIKSFNTSNLKTITGTISSNISTLNIVEDVGYKIVGKVSVYNSQKQISISQILQ